MQSEPSEVSYAHKDAPKGQRYVDFKTGKLPSWAVDVQPYDRPLGPDFATRTDSPIEGVSQFNAVTEEQSQALKDIIARHTVVGGYPDTLAIARDAFALATRTDSPTDAVEAWTRVLAGMQRLGMESTDISTVDEYFAALPPSHSGEVERVIEGLPYQATFNAIGDAISHSLTGPIGISVEKFQRSLLAALRNSTDGETK